jgi:O-antigen/teichoic acid export membrane protein
MKKSLMFMYAIVASFSLFTCVFSEEIIEIMIGNKFTGAIISLQVLSLYPLHQIYGQYSASFFMGTSATGTYRNITIFSSVFSLLATWLLIAPSDYFGLNLGSFGLAIKTLCVNIIITNISLFFITRKIKLGFMYFIYHQVCVVFLFLIVALFCKYSIQLIITNEFYNLVISGIIYFVLVVYLLRKIPFLTGLKKEEINIYVKKFTTFKS